MAWGGLLVGEASAAIPSEEDGIFTGCYQKSARTIRVIDAERGEICKPNENLITWNEPGPQGEPGPSAPKADGPCFNSNTGRYQDCGNGTVTDTVTGLIWLKQGDGAKFYEGDATGENVRYWAAANNAAAKLAEGYCGLSDNSSAGDWRLPTKAEWNVIVYPQTEAGDLCFPAFANTAGTGCWAEGDPFTGVSSYYYWSSTTNAGKPVGACILPPGYLCGGTGDPNDADVWPVRGGQ